MMPVGDFSELLSEAEKLTANIEGVAELPKVDRSLRQVLQDSNELFTKVARTGSQDVQANLLLGSQGIDLPKIVQKLDHISSKRTFEPLKPTVDTDVATYLQNEMQNVIGGIIEDNFTKCAAAASDNAWEYEKTQWTQDRLKILNSMIAPSNYLCQFDKHTAATFEELPPRTTKTLGNQEALYAIKLMEYNKLIIRGNTSQNLISMFVNAAAEFNNAKVNNMWEMVKYMSDIPPLPTAEEYSKIRTGKSFIKEMVIQGKKYLEDRYKMYMTNVINDNLAEARRGGIPGTYSLARSYVGVRLQGVYTGLQGGMIDDRPLWPLVYYCLRSGDLTAAIHCLKRASIDVKDLVKLLELKLKNIDSPEILKLENTLQMEYRSLIHNSTDPFQRIVYDVLCSCNKSEEHSEIARTADDYLWLKLSHLRFDSERDDSASYSALQTTILEEYGESHYNASSQPHLYFQMLILTGQFEAAFEFLGRSEKYRIHGVHMAIALNEMRILALSAFPNAPLISIDSMDSKPMRRLNICRLVMLYVQRFELTAPREAINYFYTLRNIKDEKKQQVFITCIVDLALETHDYQSMFGQIEQNSIRTPGIVDEFLTDEIKFEDIVQAVGKALIIKGFHEEAIDLFDLANNQDEVLNLLRLLLSQVVHLQTTEGSLRQRLSSKVIDIASRYSALGYNCSASCVSSFNILKDLLVFFDQYHAKQYALALKTLEEIQLIPLRSNEIEQRVSTFKRLSIDVNKVVPDVLLATMNILFAQYQKIKSNEYIPNRYQTASQDKQLVYIREQAKTLTNFTGMLPYHMPGDFNSKLAQMEILMH